VGAILSDGFRATYKASPDRKNKRNTFIVLWAVALRVLSVRECSGVALELVAV